MKVKKLFIISVSQHETLSLYFSEFHSFLYLIKNLLSPLMISSSFEAFSSTPNEYLLKAIKKSLMRYNPQKSLFIAITSICWCAALHYETKTLTWLASVPSHRRNNERTWKLSCSSCGAPACSLIRLFIIYGTARAQRVGVVHIFT